MRSGPVSFPPVGPAVKFLLIANVTVFFVNMILEGDLGDWLGLSASGLLDWFGLGSLRIVTYQFVHSYASVGHILMNMLVVYFFGSMVEPEVGRRGLFKLYLASGAMGGALYLLMQWAGGSVDAVVVGASGSCYGIMAYAAFMAPTSRVWFFGIFPVQLQWLVGILVFIGLYQTILELRHGVGDGVAHSAHLGGALWGFLAFRYFRASLMTADHRPWFGQLSQRYAAWRRTRQAEQAADDQAKLDALLDKVHKEGLSALSPAERRFLDRTSKDIKKR